MLLLALLVLPVGQGGPVDGGALLAEDDPCAGTLFTPRHYLAYFTGRPLRIDGRLDEPEWADVAWSEDFVDISTLVVPRHRTRMKLRWNDEFLFVGAELREPDVWATLTHHNDVIFHDNDFEVFVDADGSTHNYKEFEVNALNTTWDLLLNRPYDDGGYENSTRVFPDGGWEMQPPLVCGVYVDGPVNDPADARDDKFWTVEIALPLAKLVEGTSAALPVKTEDIWRINFSRVEWRLRVANGSYEKDPAYAREDNWVWSPQGAVAMHRPETWGFLQLSRGAPNSSLARVPPDWPVRSVAADLYYAQHAFHSAHGAYTADVGRLAPLAPSGLLDGRCSHLPAVDVAADGQGFVGVVRGYRGGWTARIHDDRLLTVTQDS